jgi:hypothetical protein
MTIKELKKHKEQLENDIGQVITAFFATHGSCDMKIDIHKFVPTKSASGGVSVNLPTEAIVNITLEI